MVNKFIRVNLQSELYFAGGIGKIRVSQASGMDFRKQLDTRSIINVLIRVSRPDIGMGSAIFNDNAKESVVTRSVLIREQIVHLLRRDLLCAAHM